MNRKHAYSVNAKVRSGSGCIHYDGNEWRYTADCLLRTGLSRHVIPEVHDVFDDTLGCVVAVMDVIDAVVVS